MTEQNIKTEIERQVAGWGSLGHPCIIERFVLRNGKLYEPKPWEGALMQARNCYGNSADLVQRNPSWSYVEGFMWRPGFPMLIQHAWVDTGDGKALDPTLREALEPGRYGDPQYFGVPFSRAATWNQALKTGYYGLLAGPAGVIATDFIFQRDPALKADIEKIIGREIAA